MKKFLLINKVTRFLHIAPVLLVYLWEDYLNIFVLFYTFWIVFINSFNMVNKAFFFGKLNHYKLYRICDIQKSNFINKSIPTLGRNHMHVANSQTNFKKNIFIVPNAQIKARTFFVYIQKSMFLINLIFFLLKLLLKILYHC